jgi:flagellar biosynthetic protein FliR
LDEAQVQGALPLGWIYGSLLFSLRVAPSFALAPPFSLTQAPALFRLLFGVGLSAAVVAGDPAAARIGELDAAWLAQAAMREFALGLVFVLVLQLMFGALYTVGRTLDIQAGYGLAVVIDPTTGNQMPLIGTLLVYGAAATFFAVGGPNDLLRLMARSLSAIPLGEGVLPHDLGALTSFMTVIFAAALGVAGGAMLCLFLADMAVAALSRTVPQMNVLFLGLQVKTLLLLIVLPITLGLSAALLARMITLTLEAAPRLL